MSQARLRLLCRGVVQGVGFRPLVHRLARELNLVGELENVAGAVRLELQGERRSLERLVRRLPVALQPPGALEPLEPEWLPPLVPAPAGLCIAAAAGQPLGPGLFAPSLAADLAPCPCCLAELRDPANRRYRYPFISCSRCGPRYSIATAEPYARAHTTLAAFPLCPACQREFDDSADRRFHAETIGCPACGPQLRLLAPDGAAMAGDPLRAAAALLQRGGILALQGVGGFQLLVDATATEAVARLRQRKRRPHKPFALLLAELAPLENQVRITPEERRELEGPAAPIVLLRRTSTAHAAADVPTPLDAAAAAVPIAVGVAPGSPCLGVMLPASPLHLLLAQAVGRPLVATSGNPSGEPLCTDPDEALERLGGSADAFLVHNRPIARPLDDSLLQLIDGRPALLRRARGYAPVALPLPASPPPAPAVAGACAVLALGGDLKAAPALAAGGRVWVAPYQGDLASPRLRQRLQHGLEAQLERHLRETLSGGPWLVADGHPGYMGVRLAEGLATRHHLALLRVQHHQAHGLAVVAEHALSGPLLVWAADGLGYGPADAAAGGHQLWGGELLWLERAETPVAACGALAIERLACLRPWPLPGGERALVEPRRVALGLLAEAGWLEHPGAAACRAAFAPDELRLLRQALASGCNAPRTSALGRLFDGAASLLDLVQELSYEGQAGLLLEGLARQVAPPSDPLAPAVLEPLASAAPATPAAAGLPLGWLDWTPLLAALLEGVAAGRPPAQLAAAWHRQLCEALVALTLRAARERGCAQVALAGGCFQNALLLEGCIAGLRAAGLAVFWNGHVPCNDGGLALGQVWAALHAISITKTNGPAAPCASPPLG
ncbi:MAG: carbamoyltransferase HypF [Cyanobacteria bacterium M_surface_10_m2_119]|nr:carbamoyltransferase HypF [Cyanobacteria bacterium M_surface_10_m2_119]